MGHRLSSIESTMERSMAMIRSSLTDAPMTIDDQI
jgi:hypothetical protein